MDSMIAKLIVSRQKSIDVLEKEIAKLKELASASRVPAAQASLEAVAQVKEQRRVKLLAELVGLRQAAGAQLEVPGAEAPVVRKK